MIVAEDEISRSVIRSQLFKWINQDNFIVDTTFYYAIEDLHLKINSTLNLCICERAVIPMEMKHSSLIIYLFH